ncbi:Ig domain-containing protein [Streptomyces sp. WZ-12]|uniref:Ig domain-containing protein n=1 Tax=Streptomyces sp. WZ-12 TaxID=3030210 RepID=UPI002380EEFD|nr:Ig domain-containing protein [Streptomyces sp. WZ-12]
MSAEAGHGRTYTIQPAGGTEQHAGHHQTFPHPLKARVVDSQNQKPVAEVPVTFAWDSMSQQALFEDGGSGEPTVTVLTDPQGYAETPRLIAGDAAGTATFTVTAPGARPAHIEITVNH